MNILSKFKTFVNQKKFIETTRLHVRVNGEDCGGVVGDGCEVRDVDEGWVLHACSGGNSSIGLSTVVRAWGGGVSWKWGSA